MYIEVSQRALRRHHVARLKRKRIGYWGRGKFLEWDEKGLGAVVQHPCVCSCWMCGNPRKWLGEQSIQERREAQESVAQLFSDQ